MDLHERELDSMIQQTLLLPVTAQQKQRAWEQLQLKLADPAAGRSSVEAVMVVEPFLSRVWRVLLSSLRSFALEEARYETARQERYAFSYYHFSASSPRLVLDLMGPLRGTAMSPVC